MGGTKISLLQRVVRARHDLRDAAQILQHVLGFRRSRAVRKDPTFSATAAAMNWFNDTPSVAASSAAAFFTDVGSFNG